MLHQFMKVKKLFSRAGGSKHHAFKKVLKQFMACGGGPELTHFKIINFNVKMIVSININVPSSQ